MRITNATARVLGKELGTYEQCKIPICVQGKRINLTPQYISLLFRTKTSTTETFIDDRRTPQEDTETKNGLLLCSYVGNGALGSGVSYGAHELSTHTPEEVRRVAHAELDMVVKVAGQTYLTGIGERIMSTSPQQLSPLGYREKHVFRDQESQKEDPERLRQLLEWSVQPMVQAGIPVSTTLILTEEESIFRDSLGSDIRQFTERIGIEYTLKGLDRQGRDLERSTTLHFAGREQVTAHILERRVQRLLREFKAAQRAITINSGSYPILLEGTATGTMIHEALAAHLLSGKYIAQGDSTVYGEGRLDELVLPHWLTIIDDPTLPGGFGSYRHDHEGTPAQPAVLIDHGILKEYLLDVESAALLSRRLGRDMRSNGRARSSWVRDDENKPLIPEPRVTNLEVVIDKDYLLTKKAIRQRFLQEIENSGAPYGLIVEGGGGEVTIKEGQFILLPRIVWCYNARGRRAMARVESIIGHADHFFEQTVAVGEPYRSAYGMCGAESGWVSTQERAPSFLLSSATAIAEPKDTRTRRLIY